MVARVDRLLWFAFYWLPVVILCGFIFYTSTITGEDVPCLFTHQDILYHFGIYVILGMFYIRALKNTGGRRTVLKLFLYTVLFGFLYGLSDELHQFLTPGRSVSALDLFIDTAGSVFGAAVGGAYFTWRS